MLQEFRAFGITNPWVALQSVRNFALTVWDPARSDIRQGVNALVYGALRDSSAERVRAIAETEPVLAALYEEGYDPALDPARLEALSDGTLGREYARMMRDNGLDPLGDLLALGAPRNLVEYGFRRAYKLHDVLHVVLGCDTSVLGEVRIVSFSVGQASRERGAPVFDRRRPAVRVSSDDHDGRAADLALAVLFLHLALRKPGEFKEAILLSRPWMELGARSKLYSTFRLEDWMDRPVAEVRDVVLGGLSRPA